MTINEIGQRIDKVVVDAKEFHKVCGYLKDKEASEYMDKRMFFPLKTFVLDFWADKRTKFSVLVELDTFNPVMGGKITTDTYWFNYKREKEKRRARIDGQGATEQVMTIMHTYVIGILIYICVTARNEVEKVSDNAEREETERDNPYKYHNRVCFLLNDIVHYTSKHPNRKSIQYQCECWGVRGHLRHYTDGRVVFIEPYKKGRLRDTLEPKSKTYMLTTRKEVDDEE